jgi:site-specific recombinase XerD
VANLYRKPVVRKDPATGEKIKTKSSKWWGQYRDATGRLRRHPLSVDKRAAQAMLHDIVRKVELEKAGLIDRTDDERRRPLSQHVEEYTTYLRNKGVTEKQLRECTRQLDKMRTACKWTLVQDITVASALGYLGDLRTKGRSAQTYNHYLKALKSFTRWMVRDRRTHVDPVAHVSRLNVAADRRHDRRALSTDEFTRLLDAARAGKKIEGISGPDRAMMYTLAAWTGFRKGEIGSLTLRALNLQGNPPTATVPAAFSKRRRQDTQVLHPELARQLQAWLATKPKLGPEDLLFPVSARAGGIERKTHKMMQHDLESARKAWLKEAESPQEQEAREKSDFLAYANHAGRYADFHSCRHLFITSLERAGIRPKVAQTLARHSDIRLTLNVYTHAELADQTAAIGILPGPPAAKTY